MRPAAISAGQKLGHLVTDLPVSGVAASKPRTSSSSSVSTTPAIFAGSTLMTGEPMRSDGA